MRLRLSIIDIIIQDRKKTIINVIIQFFVFLHQIILKSSLASQVCVSSWLSLLFLFFALRSSLGLPIGRMHISPQCWSLDNGRTDDQGSRQNAKPTD